MILFNIVFIVFSMTSGENLGQVRSQQSYGLQQCWKAVDADQDGLAEKISMVRKDPVRVVGFCIKSEDKAI